jgi:hypothetical protein
VQAVPREPLVVKGATRPVEAWEILELNEPAGDRLEPNDAVSTREPMVPP